jgi:F0F1-type ATP synthase assembly protein I
VAPRLDPRAARYSAIGLEMAGAIVGMTLLGNWLDQRWGTEPWLALTGVLLGSAAGFGAMIRLVRRLSVDDDD